MVVKVVVGLVCVVGLVGPATSNQHPAANQAQQRALAQLADAEAELAKNPDSPDALIWVGRRQAYLGRYGDAVATFTKGIERFPADARFYRHRGHRYITLRQFDNAIDDLKKAAALTRGKKDEVEPDGQPNARNIPTSTLQTNIWYHLGLAYYLKGDFASAAEAYAEDLKINPNDDNLVAVTHWAYMTARRRGRHEEAKRLLDPIRRDLEVIENGSYHRLLLMYKGELPEAELMKSVEAGLDLVTTGYGVGNWHFYNGRTAQAKDIWRRIVATDQKAAFGYIAAEQELRR